jgi:hypothetical protein
VTARPRFGSPASVCPDCGTRLAWRNGADYCIACSTPKESTPLMSTITPTRFRDLAVGQTFDFIDDSRPGFSSFFSRCMKTSSRMYATQDHPTLRYQVGSINVQVFHVEAAS